MNKDPIQYAKNQLIKRIDNCEEIVREIGGFTYSYKYAIQDLKDQIKTYFSDELQHDETPMGAMRRNQIRKELLDFAQR
jgi:hypothetical protein